MSKKDIIISFLFNLSSGLPSLYDMEAARKDNMRRLKNALLEIIDAEEAKYGFINDSIWEPNTKAKAFLEAA